MCVYQQIIKPALEETLSESSKNIEIHKGLKLIGTDSVMDSITLVSFIIIVEEKILEQYGKSVTLLDDKAFSEKVSPFKSVEAFCNFVENKLMSQNES